MKRDLDLIRMILLKIEQEIDSIPKRYSFQYDNGKMIIDGYTDEQVYNHLVMLLDSPFIESRNFGNGEIGISRLTWEGREFLDAIRNSGSWKKIKEAGQKAGGVGLGFIGDIAKAIIKTEIKSRMGLDI